MTEVKHTKDRLADALNKLGFIDMGLMAAKGFYDDYLSPLPNPTMKLVEDLYIIGTIESIKLRQRVMDGEFDATLEESEAWARSPDGKRVLSQLSPSIRSIFMPDPKREES